MYAFCCILTIIPHILPAFSNTTNISTSTSAEKPKSEHRIENQITVAARDVAYYLRAYKFNEYDRRYVTDPGKGIREYYKKFPKPPLRSLHWEVARYCEVSFHECIDYLGKKVKHTGSKRSDDTCVVIDENNWRTENHSVQINTVDEECKRMRKVDDMVADPFEGPLERFQWRTTASYYMCMYTMLQTKELRQLHDETCDNYANCLEGCDNNDPRADDTKPFACALYSFCPDPCCSNKHLNSPEECWNNPDNPCSRENEPDNMDRKTKIMLNALNIKDRSCIDFLKVPKYERLGTTQNEQDLCIQRSQELFGNVTSQTRTPAIKIQYSSISSTEKVDIVLNRWNVSCRCPKSGMEWSSMYGTCVDIDECAIRGKHNCDRRVESCVNLPGSFRFPGIIGIHGTITLKNLENNLGFLVFSVNAF
ncbi:unnamed protein product [Acanthoscelides obtectus]|uniref:NOTCH1 EGF-like calcium-binding domain-containing protein n=1 Tax=Acanthoscelides obtectus TaxID=200917 RepID=A0A9P0KQ42_ACAOB|nr:unnamed protein product [Acanthoscelides obtectus]CAK1665418.1 hypothetical protein AOBTE_LOCUS24805 [Acanthoscelides obtectus]